MALQINLEAASLIMATIDARAAANEIDVRMDPWSSQGEESISLEAYAERLLELERTMILFQALLHKDISSIVDVGRELIKQDILLAGKWSGR